MMVKLLFVGFQFAWGKSKNAKKPYGLTPRQSKERYSKERDKTRPGKQRTQEYFLSKINSVIAMVRLAISKEIRFDYLLVDSWFTCEEVVKFIKSRRIDCHFLGKIKMGKTRYWVFDKLLTAKGIVERLRRTKNLKRSKQLGCYFTEVLVDFKGIEVTLFLFKTSKKGSWSGLLTTDTQLSFEQNYKIYSIRWSIEVFFKESKQYLGLGECQSQDFDAQIAATTLCMIQYNLFALAKRFTDYETVGELFRKSQKDTLQQTIVEKI